MKKTYHKVLAVVMAVMLLMVLLAGCGEDSKIKDDPAGYLQEALTETQDDLLSRYSASPIAAIAGSIDSSSATVDFDVAINGGTAMEETGSFGIGGTVYNDSKNNEFLLDGSMSAMGISVDAQLYVQPEFIGVSCPFLLGDNTIYGFRPYDIMEQAQGSIFDENSGSEFGSDISGLQEFDDMLNAIRNSDGLSMEETVNKLMEAGSSFNTLIEFTVEDTTVTVGGKETDGYKLSGTYTGEEMAAYTEQFMSIMMENAMFSGLIDFAAESSGDITGEEFDAEIQQMLDEIRSSEIEVQVAYYIADGKIISVENTASGSSEENLPIAFTINYYDGDGSTISMTMDFIDENGDDAHAALSSTVDSANGYVHTLSLDVSSGYENASVTCTTTWDSDSGAMGTEMVFHDGTAALASLSLSGNLTAGKGKGFTFDNGSLSITDGVSGEALMIMSISFSGENGATLPAIGDMKNIFEFTENDLYSIVMNIYSVMYGVM